MSPPAAHYTAPEVMARPLRLSLLWHAGAKTEADEVIELGEDAEAKQILIREAIYGLLKDWSRTKLAAKVVSAAIEIGEKRCQKK